MTYMCIITNQYQIDADTAAGAEAAIPTASPIKTNKKIWLSGSKSKATASATTAASGAAPAPAAAAAKS